MRPSFTQAKLAAVALLFFTPILVSASSDAGGLTFGPEFTFTWVHPETAPAPAEPSTNLFQALIRELVDQKPNGRKFGVDGSNKRMKSPNGWWFNVSRDPGVAEVQMKPMSLAKFERIQDEIQSSLFDPAARLGLAPALFTGGGHINIGAAYFSDKPLLFRNFLVDLLNHNELFLGIWNYDTNNALSHSLLIGHIYNRILKAIAEFDALPNPNHKNIRNLVSNINRVMNFDDQYRMVWSRSNGPGSHTHFHRFKNMAVNFMNMTDDDGDGARIELRGFRPQVSASTWVRQIRLLEKRIHYLETFTTSLPIQPRLQVERPIPGGTVSMEQAMNPPVDPQQALQNFYEYVTEAGEDWHDHTDYIWPMWISGGELEKFENSHWFIEHEVLKLEACDRLLQGTSNDQ